MLDLVGTPEARFSRVTAHITMLFTIKLPQCQDALKPLILFRLSLERYGRLYDPM